MYKIHKSWVNSQTGKILTIIVEILPVWEFTQLFCNLYIKTMQNFNNDCYNFAELRIYSTD